MKIFYHNRNRLLEEEEKKYDACYLELEEILKTSKYLVLLLPLNTNTKHLINKNTFSKLISNFLKLFFLEWEKAMVF